MGTEKKGPQNAFHFLGISRCTRIPNKSGTFKFMLKYYMKSREEKEKVMLWTGFNNSIKVKVKLIKHHAMKLYEEVEV
jgi:hypothetical protein